MNLLYVKLGAAAVAVLFSAYLGYSFEHSRFMAFKQEVESVARTQEAKIESITKQQALVTKGIQDEHEAKLAALRNYYKSTSVWNNASGSKVPGISAAPSATDVITAYNELAGQCAQTTLMLVDLQKWLNEQIGVK
jgi:hypothetical protein